jgi:hypothetical protein
MELMAEQVMPKVNDALCSGDRRPAAVGAESVNARP